jgi:Tfp pilus assembly protein PilE
MEQKNAKFTIVEILANVPIVAILEHLRLVIEALNRI